MYLKTLSVYCKLSRLYTRTKRCTASFSHVIKMFAFIIIVYKLQCKIRFYKYFVSNERKIYKPFDPKILRQEKLYKRYTRATICTVYVDNVYLFMNQTA